MQKSFEIDMIETRQTQRVESENTSVPGQIQWVGSYQTCNKQFKHYESFCVNGVNISVCSFCHIKIEDSETGVAYIMDLYEDKKFQKKMKVRWLHKVEEIRISIPPPKPLEQEVFMTRSCQVLRLECCNGVVYVLSSHHYGVSDILPSVPYVYVCLRSFEFTEFDITTMEGYWRQDIFKTQLISQRLRDIVAAASSSYKKEQAGLAAVDEDEQVGLVPRIKKAPRSARKRFAGRYDLLSEEGDWTYQQENCCLNYESNIAVPTSPLNLLKAFQVRDPGCFPLALAGENCIWGRVGDKVEVLSQDSGMRGCWFRCTVLETDDTLKKLRYDDIREVDSDKNLEEWESMTAPDDQPGFRIPGRQNMRPPPPEIEISSAYEVGSAVDAWGGEGWWEGIMIGQNSSGQIKVGVPADEFAAWFEESDVRISREWVGGQWLAVRPETSVFNKVSGLHTRRLVSSPVQEFCHENDRTFSPEFLPGFTVASRCPCFQSARRQSLLPIQGSKPLLATERQANEVLSFCLERSANKVLACKSEEVKTFCSNPNSVAYQKAFQSQILTECKESMTLSTHDSRCSGKVLEPCPFREYKDIDSKYVRVCCSKTKLEESHGSQPAKVQQLEVGMSEENNAYMRPSGLRLLRAMPKKRHMDCHFAGSTKTRFFPCRDHCTDAQAQEQEELSVDIFKINTLTETDNVEHSHSQYGLDGVNSSTGAPLGGPLFNCVSVQSLVLSR